jgi:hypothetical protein
MLMRDWLLTFRNFAIFVFRAFEKRICLEYGSSKLLKPSVTDYESKRRRHMPEDYNVRSEVCILKKLSRYRPGQALGVPGG